MSKELKSCPFCSSRNVRVVTGVNFYVWCRRCDASGPLHATLEKATTTWNTRAGEKA
ncbi:Lar family restriction alleviation protein [Acetobacter orientalis]|uniref:Lar family restriction alleviation protein n=1 Tax=Acetobacter orientalis TaxID=146474 RepID=UPI0039E7B2EE